MRVRKNPPVRLEQVSGPTADFLDRLFPTDLTEPVIWLFEPARPALVLGSGQQESVVDESLASAAGVEVVRRRSGGGAVYAAPGRGLWLDVLVPSGHPLAHQDVRKATYWLGDAWQRALDDLGIDTSVHVGGLGKTEWGRLVCFGDIGPGEVLVDGRKLIGVAQRRTREGARFQCIVYDRWQPRDVLDLLDLSDEDRARAADDLADVALGVGDRLTDLRDAAVARILDS